MESIWRALKRKQTSTSSALLLNERRYYNLMIELSSRLLGEISKNHHFHAVYRACVLPEEKQPKVAIAHSKLYLNFPFNSAHLDAAAKQLSWPPITTFAFLPVVLIIFTSIAM